MLLSRQKSYSSLPSPCPCTYSIHSSLKLWCTKVQRDSAISPSREKYFITDIVYNYRLIAIINSTYTYSLHPAQTSPCQVPWYVTALAGPCVGFNKSTPVEDHSGFSEERGEIYIANSRERYNEFIK